MPKLKPWEERAPAAAGATPPQRTHESHSPRPQHLTGGGGGGAAAAQPPEGASKPPHRCLPRRRTRARARRRAGSEGTRATLAPFLMASAPPSDQPPPLPANDGRKRQQGGRSEPAATGAQPFAPRPRRHLRQRGQAGGQGAKARRARERMPRAARTPSVWRGRQRRRSHNERRSGGIAPHRRERHSPSVPPMSTSSCRKPPKGLRTDTISHLLPRRGLRGIPQCSARTFP